MKMYEMYIKDIIFMVINFKGSILKKIITPT